MVKLGDGTTNDAWENFKKFLMDVDLLQLVKGDPPHSSGHFIAKARLDLAHMAFKQGYVEGAKAAQSMSFAEKPNPVEKASPTRKYTSRINRSDRQRQIDGNAVETILSQTSIPIPLIEIIHRMKKNGHDHWTNNNASGFMKIANKDGFNVEKVGNGLYANKGFRAGG